MSLALVLSGIVFRLVALYKLLLILRKKRDWRLVALGITIVLTIAHFIYWNGFALMSWGEMPLPISVVSFLYSLVFLGVVYLSSHYIDALLEKQQALSDHVNLFQQFAHTAPLACFILQDNKIVFSNHAAVALTGYTGSELAAIPPYKIAHPESREHIVSLSNPMDDEITSFESSIRILQKNGDTRWGLASFGSAVYGGRPASVGTILDVTVHKNAEQAIQEAEERLRLATNASNTVIVDINLETETSRFIVPEAFAREFAFENVKNANKMLANVYGPDQDLLTGTIARCIEEHASFKIDYRRFNVRGEPVWWRLEGSAYYNESGDPVRLTGTTRYIHDQKVSEETVRENEARLRLATEVAGIEVWEWNIDSNDVIHQNASAQTACSQVTGFDNFLERVHPDHRKRVQDSVELAIRQGSRYEAEFPLQDNDGNYAWQHSVGQILYDDQLKPTSMIGAALDTTERRKKDELIHFQADLLEKIGQSIVAHNAEGEVTYFNKAASEAFDLDPEAELPLSIDHLLPDNQPIVNNPEVMDTLRAGNQWAGDLDVRTPGGATCPIFLSASPLFNAKNEFDGFIAISTNLSALRKVQEALSESEERLRLAIEAANMVVWDYNIEQQHVLHTDPSNLLKLGLQPSSDLDSVLSRIHPEDRDWLINELETCLEQQKPFHVEHRFIYDDGTQDWWYSSGKPHSDATGNNERLIGTSQRITQRKEAELLLQERVHQLQAIYQIVDAMNKAEHLEAIYSSVTEGIEKTLGTHKVAILKFEEGVTRFEFAAGLSDSYREHALRLGLPERGHASTPSLYIPDISRNPDFAQMMPYFEAEGIASLAIFPLMNKDEMLGTFVVYFDRAGALDLAEKQLATRIANHIALAIVKAEAENALIAKSFELQTIADTIPDLIFRIDRDLQVKYANKAVLEEANMTLSEYLDTGQTIVNYTPAMHDVWLESVDRALDKQEMVEFDFDVADDDPPNRSFHVLIAPELSANEQSETVLVVLRDITEERRLQQSIIDISARQQRRIGQDLHDGLGQLLTGVGFKIAGLRHDLDAIDADCATQTVEISQLVERAINQTRILAEGLNPVTLEAHGLCAGIEKLALNTEKTFGVSCPFYCKDDIKIADEEVAVQVYRIGQEAINNAIKHSHATTIHVALTQSDGSAELIVRDNGTGFRATPETREGHGLRIMNYRARVIGAVFDIVSSPGEGTTVRCKFKNRVAVL